MKSQVKYKLLLLSPRQRFINYPAHAELARIFGRKRLMIPLALPTIAALTPSHYEIRIVDEETGSLPADFKPDIVGITTLAATIKRAFELGDYYRSAGAKVVFGGPCASFMTDESLEHADSIVAGEAEGSWESCLADFEKGTIKKIYRNEVPVDYRTQKPPRWDLVNMKSIFQVAVQATRGCPFDCEFCLVSKIFGRKMRFREIDNIVAEIRSLPSKYVFFVDDNLTINKAYAKELMKAIAPLKISWGCMCSIDVAEDDELLEMMADAGCFNILIGFESMNPASLDETHKKHNKSGTIYEDAIAKIHAHGIHINASFVVGFDNDTLDEFNNIFKFSLRTGMPNVNLHLLAAPVGSELHKRYKNEGRLFECDPELGVGHFPTLHYMNVSQIDLFDWYMETIQRLYSYGTLLKKAEMIFSGGAFYRRGGDISTYLKARLSWITFTEFVVTKNPDQRKLFRFMMKMIRQKKVSVDKGLGFLLTMLSINRQIDKHRQNIKEYRQLVMRQDQGPWKES